MVDIVIVNWNSGFYLQKCLESVFTAANMPFLEKVIVVDNNSSDKSAATIQANDKLVLIKNHDNYGFAKACNQGFNICSADYTLLLNPDAALTDNTIADCISFMEKRKDQSILGCRLIDDAGLTSYTCSRFPSPVRIFFDASGLSKIAPKIFTPASIMTDWDHQESRVVDQVMGAFMFIRKQVFKDIGLFDERFFVYYEEVDFCKRLSLAGGKTYYAKDITAIHSGEGTTQSVKAFRLYLSLQSRLKYAKKYFNAAGFLLVWFSTYLIEPFARIVFHLLKGDIKGIKEVYNGMMLLIRKK